MISFSEVIGEGFSAANRNWQLILINLVGRVIGCILFLLIVVIPVVIAFFVSGAGNLSITSFPTDIRAVLVGHTGVVLTGLGMLLLYITIISTVGLYLLGAYVGMLSRVVTEQAGFSLDRFFTEGKRMFLPTLRYTALLGFIGIGVIIGASFLLTGIYALVMMLRSLSPTLSLFMAIFFGVTGGTAFLVLIFGLFGTGLYGLGIMAIREERAWNAFKEALSLLVEQPALFLLSVILILGSMIISILLGIGGLPLRFIPVIGLVLGIPYQVLATLIQGYLTLLVLGTGIAALQQAGYRGDIQTTAGMSTQDSGTSPGEDPLSGPSPPEE